MGNIQNDLVRRARLAPAELTIRPNQVGALADQARHDLPDRMSRCEIERRIMAGEMKFMDIPVRVLGDEPGTVFTVEKIKRDVARIPAYGR